jgi:predicted DNA-binding transcriptional regulator YafY
VQAIKENVCLKISRQGFGSDNAYTFTIKPYGIKVFKQRWYIVGVPSNSEQIKNYALDRTHHIELTDEHFDMPENFDLSTHFYNSYGVYTDDLEDHPVDTIRIKADNQQRYYLRTLPLHHSQKEVERTKDYSIFEVKLSPSYDFIYEILSKGDGVEILAPKWFREEIASYVRAMHRSYKDTIEVLNQRDEKLFTTVKRACHSSKELSSLQ